MDRYSPLIRSGTMIRLRTHVQLISTHAWAYISKVGKDGRVHTCVNTVGRVVIFLTTESLCQTFWDQERGERTLNKACSERRLYYYNNSRLVDRYNNLEECSWNDWVIVRIRTALTMLMTGVWTGQDQNQLETAWSSSHWLLQICRSLSYVRPEMRQANAKSRTRNSQGVSPTELVYLKSLILCKRPYGILTSPNPCLRKHHYSVLIQLASRKDSKNKGGAAERLACQ